MKTFVLATANKGKIKEMQSILSRFGISAISRDELKINIEIEETGTTFLENATIKARKICELSLMPAIADDSGLVVEALAGEPGVYSSSFGGENLTDSERCQFLLKKLDNMEQRDAKFVSTIVCVFPDGREISATGECHGRIAKTMTGLNGFGYDPVFIPNEKDQSMAALSPDEKNRISHRSKALNEFIILLKADDNV